MQVIFRKCLYLHSYFFEFDQTFIDQYDSVSFEKLHHRVCVIQIQEIMSEKETENHL